MSDQDEQNIPPTPTGGDAQPNARQQTSGNERNERGHRHGRRRSGNQTHSANEPRRQESGISASINMMELRDLVELIATHGFTDFELEREGFRVRLRREHPPTVAVTPSQSPGGASSVTAPLAASFAGTSPPVAVPSAVAPTTPAATDSTPPADEASDADLHKITSPIVGTFYRSPSPTSESFVRVGSAIEADTVVCIVEAMKLMNEILAETSGTIEKIYVENAQPVEYGQPLFGVRK